MEKFSKILEMSEEGLMKEHDEKTGSTSTGGHFYVEEYYRRQQEKSGKLIEKMTKSMLDYTRWMTILTIINVILVIVALFK